MSKQNIEQDIHHDEQVPPPPYSPAESPALLQHHPSSEHTFDSIQEHIVAARHSYELRYDEQRLLVSRCASGEGRLIFEVPAEQNDSDQLVLYQAHTRRIAAQARLPRNAADFEFVIDWSALPQGNAWRNVHYKPGGMLKGDSYHFVAGDSRKLVWRPAHEHALGPSKSDWKLEDESNVGKPASAHRSGWARRLPNGGENFLVVASGTEIARYHHERSRSPSVSVSRSKDRLGPQVQGRIDWNDEHGEDVEIASLVVLIAILERGAKRVS